MTPTDTRRPDRDDVLTRVDLDELLATLGERRGLAARGGHFPCPNPTHEQSGKTPPVSSDRAPGGYGLWRCHACGAGGTAFDALITAGVARDFGDALTQLADQVLPAMPITAAKTSHPNPPGSGPTAAAQLPASPGPSADQLHRARAELSQYIDDCHQRLTQPGGEAGLGWLRARGLTDAEIARHSIGLDPGYKTVQRERKQLPAPAGPAITFPLLDTGGQVTYCQARPLDDSGAKYLNPHADWIGPSPRVGHIVSPDTADPSVLVACEGLCDAILAGRHFHAQAIIGAGQPDQQVAARLIDAARGRPVVVCFDADPAGHDGAQRLVALLGEQATSGAVAVTPPADDINQLLLDAPDEFDDTLRTLILTAAKQVRPDRAPSLRAQLTRLDRVFMDPAGGRAQATGFAALDAVLAGGLREGVYMLAAPPGTGKTAFATQVGWHIARSGHPVLYWATEQTDEQLVARHVCSQAQLNVSHYWRRTESWRDAWRRARPTQPADTLCIAHDEPVSEHDDRGSVARLAAMLAEHQKGGGAKPVVIIDYLQDLQPDLTKRTRDEREQLSATARALLRLARREAVPMLIISSVARDKYTTERPTLAAFKGSGDIEYTLDAGLVLRFGGDADQHEKMIDEEWDELPLELHPVKNRFGRAGGGEPIQLKLHADTGTVLDGDGDPCDNHPLQVGGDRDPGLPKMPF